MPEHIAQVVERFVWGLPQHESRGILGFLDLEPVHFIYNLGLLALLFISSYGLGIHKTHSQLRRKQFFFYLFSASIAIQSYHSIEHVAKIIQFTQTGMQGTPGIVGLFGWNLIWFHFYINLAVYSLMLGVFFGLKTSSSAAPITITSGEGLSS